MRPLLLILLLASPAIAQTREPFPSDFTASPCASKGPCVSFPKSSIRSAAHQVLGLHVDSGWIYDHWDENMELFAPACSKRATCLATSGNDPRFCSAIFAREVERTCDAHYSRETSSKEWEKCRAFARVWAFGVASNAAGDRAKVQECVTQQPAPAALRKMEVWIDPPYVPSDSKDALMVYAVDSQTRVPVQADIAVEGDKLLSPESLTGKPITYYPFTLKSKVRRVANAQGHQDLVPADLVLTAPNYETVRVPVPTNVSHLDVKMTPAKLKRGKNTVRITAKDAATGAPVEMRVFVGDQQIGNTNETLEIELPRKKQPEIWLKSLYNAYGDVVVAPAGK